MLVTRAKVAEGLKLAELAKFDVSETYAFRHGLAIPGYAGVGSSRAGSFGFQFTPTNPVASIAISAIKPTPEIGDGQITITYSPAVGVPGIVIHLTPGSGVVVGGEPAGSMQVGNAIVWGCDVGGVTANFPYVPPDCRF